MDRNLNVLNLALVGIGLIASSAIVKNWAILGPLGNISVTYFMSVLGASALFVSVHCAIFRAPVAKLPLAPSATLYVLVAVALQVDVVWDGLTRKYSLSQVLLGLADSAELAIVYAAVLFLPRWPEKRVPESAP